MSINEIFKLTLLTFLTVQLCMSIIILVKQYGNIRFSEFHLQNWKSNFHGGVIFGIFAVFSLAGEMYLVAFAHLLFSYAQFLFMYQKINTRLERVQ